MFNTDQLLRIIQESALLLRHNVNMADLKGREESNRIYDLDEQEEFTRDLMETGNAVRILFLEYTLNSGDFQRFLDTLDLPILVFRKTRETVQPEIIWRNKKRLESLVFQPGTTAGAEYTDNLNHYTDESGQIKFFAIAAYDHLVSEPSADEAGHHHEISPVSRLFRLLGAERKDILYILFYAFVVGLISLVLPLGIQTTTELVSGGVFFSSIYVLIGLIILGVLFTGGLQIVQITLVEYLQRRVFTKAAYEFAYRLPKMKSEAISHQYVPELVNRFFDIMTIQKGLPKLLIDLSSAALQIVFGLLLISLYHPFFVFFGIVLMGTLILIFLYTGPKGMKSSIQESKYKYKVAYWLQELGRAMSSFKVAGNTTLPLRKTDFNVNNYLKYRKSHFQILITQFTHIVLFKAGITSALLIMGTILVIDRQITLGQFVASEVIIILILASVEKIITYMDVVYDMLTAVDKIGHVTDLPIEKSGGVDLPKNVSQLPFALDVKDLRYKYPEAKQFTLKGVSLSIKSGEKVCIAGPGESGKSTLTQLITGMHNHFEGSITFNRYSIRDLDLTSLRDRIAKNISPEDIFDGSIFENISVGKPSVTLQHVIEALEKTKLSDWVNQLPEGLNTPLLSGGKGLSNTVILKLILARCIAKRPSLIVLNDFFSGLRKSDKVDLIQMLTSDDTTWTMMAVSNDPVVMASCDRVIVLKDGVKIGEGTFQELMKTNLLNECLD